MKILSRNMAVVAAAGALAVGLGGAQAQPKPTPGPSTPPPAQVPPGAKPPPPFAKAGSAPGNPNRPTWMRYPAVSPDGTQIAFSYAGQIWVVPTAGGRATPLTSRLYYSRRPVWSPDSKNIAFASTRYGNFDVFVMPAAGGPTRRLTTHSSNDEPWAFSPDGKQVYFTSIRLGDAKISFYNGKPTMSRQLYAVPAIGGRERIVIPMPAHEVQPSRDGKFLLYTNQRSIEQEWRKHEKSDAARDVWAYDVAKKRYIQVTRYRGNDRNAVWSASGRSIFYLSERSGLLQHLAAPVSGARRPSPDHRAQGPSGSIPLRRQGRHTGLRLRRGDLEAVAPAECQTGTGQHPNRPGHAAGRPLFRAAEPVRHRNQGLAERP